MSPGSGGRGSSGGECNHGSALVGVDVVSPRAVSHHRARRGGDHVPYLPQAGTVDVIGPGLCPGPCGGGCSEGKRTCDNTGTRSYHRAGRDQRKAATVAQQYCPNVLVSALISAHGPPARLIKSWHAGLFEMIVFYESRVMAPEACPSNS